MVGGNTFVLISLLTAIKTTLTGIFANCAAHTLTVALASSADRFLNVLGYAAFNIASICAVSAFVKMFHPLP
jgi:hypothetical protein